MRKAKPQPRANIWVHGKERLRIARFLDKHGHTWGADLRDRLGYGENEFWQLINCAWFSFTGKGYFVTDAGRADIAKGRPK